MQANELIDAEGVKCRLCFNCRNFKRPHQFTIRSRGCKDDADHSHHCIWCLYVDKRAKADTESQAPNRCIHLSEEDISASLPTAPRDEPAMYTYRGDHAFPPDGNRVVRDVTACRIHGCDGKCVDEDGGKPHKSQLCPNHRGRAIWEITPHLRRQVRWCSQCCCFKAVRAWAEGEEHRPTCTEGRLAKAKRQRGENIVHAYGERAPSGHEWLRWHSGRIDVGADPPVRGRGGRRKPRAGDAAGPSKLCLVHGCPHDQHDDKSQVCKHHLHSVLASEGEEGGPLLWMYCFRCRAWRAAYGFSSDGRCSPSCRAKGTQGLKTSRAAQFAAKVCAEVTKHMCSPNACAHTVMLTVCEAFAIGSSDPLVPVDSSKTSDTTTAAETSDKRKAQQCCFSPHGSTDTCGTRFHDGHASGMCQQHRNRVIVRGGALQWWCPGCASMRLLAGVKHGMCAACVGVRAQRSDFLAKQPAVPPSVVVEPPGLGLHPVVSCARTTVGECSRHADHVPTVPRSTPSADTVPEDVPTHSASDDCLQLADAPDGIAMSSEPAVVIVDSDGNETDGCEQCDDAPCEEITSVAEVVEIAAPVKQSTETCRGDQCQKPITPGTCLGGACLTCIATCLLGASPLDLYVLAVVPGALYKGAGKMFLTVHVTAHPMPCEDMRHVVW